MEKKATKRASKKESAKDILYGGLTKKEYDFCLEWLRTGNGTQAALKAYDTTDYNTAHSIAVENLQKVALKEWLANYLAEYSTEKDVMRELYKDIASGDKQLRINALNLVARIKAMVSERHINVDEQRKEYSGITYGDFAEKEHAKS